MADVEILARLKFQRDWTDIEKSRAEQGRWSEEDEYGMFQKCSSEFLIHTELTHSLRVNGLNRNTLRFLIPSSSLPLLSFLLSDRLFSVLIFFYVALFLRDLLLCSRLPIEFLRGVHLKWSEQKGRKFCSFCLCCARIRVSVFFVPMDCSSSHSLHLIELSATIPSSRMYILFAFDNGIANRFTSTQQMRL